MTVIYPKDPREKNYRLNRRWRVDYVDMICEGGGGASWSKGYRTWVGARVAAWFWYHIGTYGGKVSIECQK